MISLWEQASFLSYDVIIVGAGITGLSAAASLKEKNSKLNVLVLERGTLPTGASTKNAGFACFGSLTELIDDRRKLGADGMLELVHKRWTGLQKTIKRLGAGTIGLEKKGGYELLTDENASDLHYCDEINALLKSIFDQPVYSHAEGKLRDFGFQKTKHLIYNPLEGQLHTGKLMKALWQYCNRLGVQVLTGTVVDRLEETEAGIDVITPQLTFSARAVGVCTNAFTASLIEQPLDLQPGRGIVLLVRPSRSLAFEGTFHFDSGFYYFRDFEDKLIFGGGRNLAPESESTTSFGLNVRIIERLNEELRTRIIPGQDYEIERYWSGIMAFGPTKMPILERHSTGVFLGVRLGGMGVAIGSMVGQELADLILSEHF